MSQLLTIPLVLRSHIHLKLPLNKINAFELDSVK